jgi:hypothetical protein
MTSTDVVETPEAPEAPAPDQTNPAPEATPEPAPEPTVKGGNSNWAPEADREALRTKLKQLRADGWTRPAISKHTGFSDSQVWRGQNAYAHGTELATWVEFLTRVKAGELKPPQGNRKLRVEDVQAQLAEARAAHEALIQVALAKLGDEAKTVAQYRKLVDEARDLLTGKPVQADAEVAPTA